MDALMIPLAPASEPGKAAEAKVAAKSGRNGSFSKYLDQKMTKESRAKKNLLGVKNNLKKGAADRPQASQPSSSKAKADQDEAKASAILALLGQFLDELRDKARDAEAGPGAWTFTASDSSLLQQLAVDAGMDQAEVGLLLEHSESRGGKLEMGEFLGLLSRHFKELAVEKPVTVPETELPLLEIFLERLGVPADTVQKIAEQAVTGDNKLDLAKFLQGLDSLDAKGLTRLTDLEAEQLQDILAKAGASKELQRALLPERHSTWENPAQANKTVVLSLARLKSMLAQGMREAKAEQLQVDLPAVFEDLKKIFGQAGFEEKTAGWSPAVQKAVAGIYDQLLDSVDLSTVRLAAQKPLPEAPGAPQLSLKEKIAEGLEGLGEDGPETVLGAAFKDSAAPKVDIDPAKAELLASEAELPETPSQAGPGQKQDTLFAARAEAPASETPPAPASDVKPGPHAPRLTPELQFQTFERLSQAVVRGLRHQDHHLVLRLYPKELGEVKVEMMVRHDHVAVSFAMENSKVKEIMENNMDMFRENLEQQGFVLQECMVSVGQHDQGKEAWQQFDFARQNRQNTLAKASPAALPENILYQRPQLFQAAGKGIDLIA